MSPHLPGLLRSEGLRSFTALFYSGRAGTNERKLGEVTAARQCGNSRSATFRRARRSREYVALIDMRRPAPRCRQSKPEFHQPSVDLVLGSQFGQQVAYTSLGLYDNLAPGFRS